MSDELKSKGYVSLYVSVDGVGVVKDGRTTLNITVVCRAS